MPIPHRIRRTPVDEKPAPASYTAPGGPAPTDQPRPEPARRAASPTRTSVAWAGVWTAAIVAIAFIVFMLQNTTGVRVSFLGMNGELPLAVALLIAMVAGVVLTLILGTARITQLRRLARRRTR